MPVKNFIKEHQEILEEHKNIRTKPQLKKLATILQKNIQHWLYKEGLKKKASSKKFEEIVENVKKADLLRKERIMKNKQIQNEGNLMEDVGVQTEEPIVKVVKKPRRKSVSIQTETPTKPAKRRKSVKSSSVQTDLPNIKKYIF